VILEVLDRYLAVGIRARAINRIVRAGKTFVGSRDTPKYPPKFWMYWEYSFHWRVGSDQKALANTRSPMPTSPSMWKSSHVGLEQVLLRTEALHGERRSVGSSSQAPWVCWRWKP
jgi:hypothetical protein